MENEKKEAKPGAKLAECLRGADEQCCQDALDFLDLPPEKRKAALASVNGESKPETPDATAQDSKAKDGDEVPVPPEKGADKPKEKEDEGGEASVQAPAPAPSEASVPTPAPASEGEGDDGVPATDMKCKGKGCAKDEIPQTAEGDPKAEGETAAEGDDCPSGGKCKDDVGDGKCDKCDKPLTTDGGEPCCHEGKGGKPCCEDGQGKDCGTVTAPSAPVPTAKVTDCGTKLTKEAMDELSARIRADYNRAQKLAALVKPMVETFDSAEMTEAQVARHAVKNIKELAFAADAADEVVLGVIRGYLARPTKQSRPATLKVPTADEAVPPKKVDMDAGDAARELSTYLN